MHFFILLACSSLPMSNQSQEDSVADTTTAPILVSDELDRVTITGPVWGFDHATSDTTVTLVGTATGTVSWETTDASGTADGTEDWTAAVPLVSGDNTILVRSGDAADVITISSTPGLSWDSGLRVDHQHVRVGNPTTITVRVDIDAEAVWLDGQDLELAQDRAGSWTGQFEWTPDEEGIRSIRAVARVGDVEGSTPPWTLTAIETPDMDAVMALADHAAELAAGLDDAEAAESIAQLEGVEGVLVGANSISWRQEPGVTFVLPRGEEGTKGTIESTDAVALSPWFSDWPAPGEAINWWDYGEQFGQRIVAKECPVSDSLVQEFGGDADVAAFEGALGAGLVHLSTHGTDSYQYLKAMYQDGTADSFVIVKGGATALMTGESWVTSESDHHFEDLVDGDIVILMYKGERVLALSAGWFRDLLTVNPMPNSVVSLDACLSATLDMSLPNALLEGGAGFVWGYDEVVRSDEAYEAADIFWSMLLEHNTTALAAFEAAEAQVSFTTVEDRPRAPALQWDGDPELVQGFTWENGSFEDGYEDWGSTRDYGDGDVRTFDWYVASNVRDVVAADGTYFAGMELHSDTATYSEIHQYTCPSPGTELWISFQWLVLTEEAPNCAASVPNWMNLRHDDDAISEVLWQLEWADICADLSPQGGMYSTGWHDETVVIEVPEGFSPATERYTFSTGGYNANTWVAMVDGVSIEVVE